MGMGMGPIPWDKIMEYADRYELDEENTEAFNVIIRMMDIEYLNWHEENRNSDE